jgi:hypothetical protein
MANPYFRDSLGISLLPWTTDRIEVISLSLVATGGLIAGILPAVQAYHREPLTDLSSI